MRLKCREPCQLVYESKFGDASLVCQSENTKTFYAMYNSINLDYLIHKKTVLEREGIRTQPLRTHSSGYKENSVIYAFGTRNHHTISKVGNITVDEVLDHLTVEGLVYFFLDDGSFHQRKHFGHIYCNTFTNTEVEHLIEVMYKFYPQKRCKKRIDRKKDGRTYPYIYIPVAVMKPFREDVKRFLVDNDIQSLMYKVGGS